MCGPASVWPSSGSIIGKLKNETSCPCLGLTRTRSIRPHRAEIEQENISQVLRWREDYPYRSHAQPWLAYGAFIGCVFILLVTNGAPLWNGFHAPPFLSSYLTVSDTYDNLIVISYYCVLNRVPHPRCPSSWFSGYS